MCVCVCVCVCLSTAEVTITIAEHNLFSVEVLQTVPCDCHDNQHAV